MPLMPMKTSIKYLIVALTLLACASPKSKYDMLLGEWQGVKLEASATDLREDLLREAQEVFKSTTYQFSDSIYFIQSSLDSAGSSGVWAYTDSINTLILSPEDQMASVMKIREIDDATLILERNMGPDRWVLLHLKKKP